MNNVQKWEDISSGIAIRTDVYQSKIVDNKDSGMLEFVRQRTYKNLGRKRPSFKTSSADLKVFLSDRVQ